MKIVCISDTHQRHEELTMPAGDVLIHAGDFCNRGTIEELQNFAAWLKRQPYKHKIVVAGNHDLCCETAPETSKAVFGNSCHYLFDSGVTIDGEHFWGSPWQPWFHDWAFNLHRGIALRIKWALIPVNTTVLVTHSPPSGIQDRVTSGERVGCADLRMKIERLQNLKLHVFGHIHEARGQSRLNALHINASCVNGAVVYQFPITTVV